MDPQTASYYAKNASRLAREYAQVGPDYLAELESIFADCQTILDVGCGTGRDALHLLLRGKNVFGVEPSPEMLDEARAAFERAGQSWRDRLVPAALPKLDPFEDASFDGVLCAAVLMHLPEEEIFDAVYGLKRVLRHGGLLVVSIPDARPGIDSTSRRDEEGRLFTDLPPDKLQLLFERVGFRVERSMSTSDALARSGHSWRTLVLRRLDDARDRPLHLVEGILNRDNKVATYKLALFRALSDLAQTRPHIARFTHDGKVTIPNAAIAEKWLLYYWPIFASPDTIRQGTSQGAADVAIRPKMTPLIAHYASRGGLPAFYVEWRSGRMNQEARRLTDQALAKLKSTIWQMPVRYAGGGEFDILQYDRTEKAIIMDAALWRELCLTGNWIQDATVLRWAELTEQINRGVIKASTVIDCLLTVPNEERNVADARRFYAEWADRSCVWTARDLPNRFEVDHAMPFSLWRNNDLWNLLPASDKANREKRDRLPTYELLHRRRDNIIHCWRGLGDAYGERFRNEAQSLMGREALVTKRWENQLFNRFVEAIETTANQRGAARWDPEESADAAPARVVLKPASPPYPMPEERIYSSLDQTTNAAKQEPTAPAILPFHEIREAAFQTHLPIVASLAAGTPFHGFETRDLSWLDEVDWIAVPASLAKPGRFVVRIAGDSMEPTLRKGAFAVFEWHRTPRRNGQIVIANLPEFGPGQDSTEAVKRFRDTPDEWVFQSDNPAHGTLHIRKNDTLYPILGTFVESL